MKVVAFFIIATITVTQTLIIHQCRRDAFWVKIACISEESLSALLSETIIICFFSIRGSSYSIIEGERYKCMLLFLVNNFELTDPVVRIMLCHRFGEQFCSAVPLKIRGPVGSEINGTQYGHRFPEASCLP